MQQLIREVAELTHLLLGLALATPYATHSYAEIFQIALGVDPLTASNADLRALTIAHKLEPQLAARCERDELLDWLMGTAIGPMLGKDGLCFIHHYPVSQAALARVDAADPRVALRFELYYRGVELANGFEELADAVEQRSRFLLDRQARARRGLPVPEIDQSLLDALTAGLPAVSGVALGFDRLLMLRTGAQQISEVLAFALERA